MFRKLFNPFKRVISSRLSLLTLSILPLYLYDKNKVLALDSATSPVVLSPKPTKPK